MKPLKGTVLAIMSEEVLDSLERPSVLSDARNKGIYLIGVNNSDKEEFGLLEGQEVIVNPSFVTTANIVEKKGVKFLALPIDKSVKAVLDSYLHVFYVTDKYIHGIVNLSGIPTIAVQDLTNKPLDEKRISDCEYSEILDKKKFTTVSYHPIPYDTLDSIESPLKDIISDKIEDYKIAFYIAKHLNILK